MKLKLSKRIRLILGAALLIGVLAGLNMMRSGQTGQQEEVEGKLAQIQSRLRGVQVEQISARQAELETKLGQVNSRLDAVKALLAKPIGSVSVTNRVFDLARAQKLEVTQLSSSDLVAATLDGVPCWAVRVSITVEGDIANLVSFVAKLNNSFATGVVESVAITVQPPPGNRVSADMKLAVYTSVK